MTPRPLVVLLKALVLFLVFNLLYGLGTPPLGRLTLYNALFPGRPRFPFGENIRQAHNLSIGDIDALFNAHLLAGTPKATAEQRVLILGDSSVWGTLLRPEETLSARLNAAALTCQGKSLRFYNLGYPTLSLTKDLLLLDYAQRYQADAVLWLVTLESFATDTQLTSPLLAANPQAVRRLIRENRLPLDEQTLPLPTFWQRTLLGQRRALADWARLQLLGVIWAASGVDQYYPERYTPAQIDLSTDTRFHQWDGPNLPHDALAWEVLRAAQERIAPRPLLLVNEPILISPGKNSHLRYNFYYPRWAYDQYRQQLEAFTLANNLPYVDAWDWFTHTDFTNTAIHLTPLAESRLAQALIPAILEHLCR